MNIFLINLDEKIMVFNNFNNNLADKIIINKSNKGGQEQIQGGPLTPFCTLNQEARLLLL